MFAEAMAGISLVKASVDFIKSNIDTAKDIGELASGIDGLFRGNDEAQVARSKKARLGVGDQLGIKNVAQEIIDAKLAEEKMQEMRNMIDMRFGPGTWKSIVDERAKRIQEAKEQERLAKIKRIKEEKALWEMIKQGAIIFLVVACMAAALVGTIWLS
jgi:hypothetical protein